MKYQYDVIVIGAGSGGLTSSIGLAKAGKKVLLVERDKMGGDCTNTGCIPSKALIHQAHKAHESPAESKQLTLLQNTALAAVRSTIESFLTEESPELIEKHGNDNLTVVMGDAKFVDTHTIHIAQEHYSAKNIIIASGSSPRTIDIKGAENANIHTSDSIFTLKEIPKKLLVIGSGPIGMELGQAFSRLGSAVTLASIDNALGKLEDPEVAKEVQKQFTKENIAFVPMAYIREIKNDTLAIFDIKVDGEVIDTKEITFDAILLSIGRVPNLDMNLEAARIDYSPMGIKIGKKYRTTERHIYAIGDVSDRLKFTHTADDAARNVLKQILIPLPLFGKKRVVPKVTFTYPELAQVGLSHKEAEEIYGADSIMKVTVPFATLVDRAKVEGNGGVLVIITKRLSGKIIGAHIAHARAGDMISFFTLAIKSKVTMWQVNNMIFPYPSYSLAIKKASDIFLTQTLQNAKGDIWHLVKKHSIKIFALFFWGILLYSFNAYKAAHGLDSRELSIMLASFVTGTVWGPVLYMIFYIFRPLILFPAVLLTTLSGVMFGFWGGFIFTFIGENISASFVYLIGRFFGGNIKFEDTAIGTMVTKIKEEPFISILLSRLLFFPFDLTNLACGAIKARWRSYALATAIGIIPGMATFIALGASFENVADFDLGMLHINMVTLISSLALFIFSLILAKVLRKYKHK